MSKKPQRSSSDLLIRKHLLITKEIKKKLLENGSQLHKGVDQNTEYSAMDVKPVVKFFTPMGQATWLIVEMNPNDENELFGLCDLGHGFPELGYVHVDDLNKLYYGPMPNVERDLYWEPTKTLREYFEEATEHGSVRA